ncbi:MAG: helix-turn-helix transcriptional regulator [Planctomycetes bacterium]|nr:helix-turn-helix transcriptional regulator [Planctomycetota bacterium]
MSLGKAILRARHERGLTQATLGGRAGVATSYFSRLENGRVQPTMATISRIASALGVSLADLVRFADEPEGKRLHACPVSGSGECIGELIRSGRGQKPKVSKPTYGPEELRLLRMTELIARDGSAEVRTTLTVVLEGLVERANLYPR